MSLHEAEIARSRHAHRTHKKRIRRHRRQHRPVLTMPLVLHDQQVLSVRQWCQLANISLRTGRKHLAEGTGPEVIQLSDKRVGITVAADREWKARRARPTTTTK
jgi:predicted DNA-binding transcriptional regulator AlpA